MLTGWADALGLPRTGKARRLVLASLIDTLGAGLFLPLAFLYFTLTTGLPTSSVGLAISLATLVALASAPLDGTVTDRVGAQPVVVVSNLLTAAGYALYPLAGGPAGIFGCVLLVMVADRLYFAAWPTLISRLTTSGHLDSWYALVQAVAKGSLGIGALVSSVFLAGRGAGAMTALLYLNVATSLVSAALVLTTRLPHGAGRPPAPGTADPSTWGAVLKDAVFRRVVLVQGLLAAAWVLPATFLPLYLVRTLKLPLWQPALLFGGGCLLLLLAQTWLTKQVRRIRRTRVVLLGIVALLASLALIGSARVAPPAVVIPVGVLVFTIGEMLCAPTMSALAATLAPASLRGRYLSLFELTGGVAFGLGPGLVGVLYALDPAYVLCGLGAGVALGAAVLVDLEPRLPVAANGRLDPSSDPPLGSHEHVPAP